MPFGQSAQADIKFHDSIVKLIWWMTAILFVVGLIVWANVIGEPQQISNSPNKPENSKSDVAEKDYSNPATIAQELAKVNTLEPIILQARACIRSGIPDAYKSGVYGGERALSFFSSRCFGPYNAAFQKIGYADTSASGFRLLVDQELAR